MLVGAIASVLKPAVQNETLFYISSTTGKSVYASRIKDVLFDDTNNIITWTDSTNGLLYHMDYADINFIIETTPNTNLAMTMY